MKSKFLPLALFASTALSLAACGGTGSDGAQPSPAAPVVAPGTVEAVGTDGSGSYQGAVANEAGEIQAILTLDVYDSNAQLTVTPNGATEVLPLDEGRRSFHATLGNVKLTGTWNGSAWMGEISNGTQTDSFVLNAGASSLAAVGIGAPSGSFDGVLDYQGGRGKHRMSLVLTPASGLSESLASLLTSKVNLTGALVDSRGKKEPLTNLVWDRETSTLSGDSTVKGSSGTTSLRCKMSEVAAQDRDVLQCTLSSSKRSSPVATGTLSQKRVVVAPPYPVRPKPAPVSTPARTPVPAPVPVVAPAPAPALEPEPVVTDEPPTPTPTPAPTPIVNGKNERVFTGSGIFKNEKGEKQTRSLSLTVTLKSDATGVDQEAVVKFIIDGSRVGAKFTDGVFNGASGELRASQMLTLGPIAGALKLKCAGVSFASTSYDYYCHYESSVTNVTGEFHLKGTSH